MALTEFGALDRRLELVDFALSWVGKPAPAEMWLRMLGKQPPVWRPGKKRIHWCSLFCAWCLCEMEIAHWTRFRLGTGFAQFGLPTTKAPEPGDVAVYRGSAEKPVWHHAFIDVDPDPTDALGLLPLIEGNVGAPPGQVGLGARPLEDAWCYYSIAGLLQAEIPTLPGMGPTKE